MDNNNTKFSQEINTMQNTVNQTHFIVQTASAKMPSSCWGQYRRVAVLEVAGTVKRVSMISSRARGVKAIVETWEKLNVGSTERCAYRRALREAIELAEKLNAGAAV
jgi:hypothetical protein